jgi:hypothetical protein
MTSDYFIYDFSFWYNTLIFLIFLQYLCTNMNFDLHICVTLRQKISKCGSQTP